MIKIEVSGERRQKYLDTVGEEVLKELDGLRTAIDHLTGVAHPYAYGDNFPIYKAAANTMVNMVVTPAVDDKKFNQEDYEDTIRDYRATGIFMPQSVIDNITGLLDYLTLNKAKNLNELLLCPPEELKDRHEHLVKTYKLDGVSERKIAGLAFSYKNCKKVNEAVKAFYRTKGKELTLICPYCNLHKANFIAGDQGGTGEVHELDHFFEKTGHWLLCYSLYNLVPSDGHCNGAINKGDVPFEKEYHLNPYENGFGRLLRFKPIGNGKKIDRFEVEVEGRPTDLMYDRMLGKTGTFNDKSKSGNLNVFKIKARYNDPILLRDAAKMAKKISSYAAGRRNILSVIRRMGKKVTLQAHKEWYEDTLLTFFEEKEFNNAINSKLYRDLHDHIFLAAKPRFNGDVIKLVKDHPQSH